MTDVETESWVSEACTLPTVEQPLRVAEFDALFATALRGVHRQTPTQLRLVLAGSAEATARELATRETECCSFFRFGFGATGDGAVAMDVAVPAAQVSVLDALATRARSAQSG
ncbi:MAG TPA: hypothetical protein VIL54_10225 [Natronosporangium sp.]